MEIVLSDTTLENGSKTPCSARLKLYSATTVTNTGSPGRLRTHEPLTSLFKLKPYQQKVHFHLPYLDNHQARESFPTKLPKGLILGPSAMWQFPTTQIPQSPPNSISDRPSSAFTHS